MLAFCRLALPATAVSRLNDAAVACRRLHKIEVRHSELAGSASFTRGHLRADTKQDRSALADLGSNSNRWSRPEAGGNGPCGAGAFSSRPERGSRLVWLACRQRQEDGVDDVSLRAIGAKAFVSARLNEMETVLDGFRAAVLLDHCLTVDSDSAVDRRAQGLVEHILTHWANTIERDLERFPPATIDVLQTIRQRMVDARDALLRVRSLLQGLSDLAPLSAEPNEWPFTPRADQVTRMSPMEPSTDTGRPGSALCDALRQLERDAVLQGNSRRAASPAHWPGIAASMPPSRPTERARS